MNQCLFTIITPHIVFMNIETKSLVTQQGYSLFLVLTDRISDVFISVEP